MYHIKHDKRAESSVELICTAVLELLETKPLGEITVSDVQRRSTVSRSTFYRNFDSLEDVLALLCDRGFDEIASVIASFDEVDSVLLMSGSYDLQVIIKGHSFQEIALFVAKRLSPLDDVLSTATSFVLRPYKRGGKLYLNEEADERECTVL